MTRPTDHAHPGPWHFYIHRFGFRHVITDGEGRHMVSGVPIGSGPLLAAGPEFLAALERVAEVTAPGTEAHEIASGAIEAFREREAMVLADWRPQAAIAEPPRELRIAGVATWAPAPDRRAARAIGADGTEIASTIPRLARVVRVRTCCSRSILRRNLTPSSCSEVPLAHFGRTIVGEWAFFSTSERIQWTGSSITFRECQAAVKLAERPGDLNSTALGVLVRAGSTMTRWHVAATHAQPLQTAEGVDLEQFKAAHKVIIAEIRRRWACELTDRLA